MRSAVKAVRSAIKAVRSAIKAVRSAVKTRAAAHITSHTAGIRVLGFECWDSRAGILGLAIGLGRRAAPDVVHIALAPRGHVYAESGHAKL